MLKPSYVSSPIIDLSSVNYSFGKIYGVIIADVDKNGYTDIITFPTHFSVNKYLSPVVWSNTKGVFTPNNAIIQDLGRYQTFRDSVAGDFNNDGYMDYIQIDPGWETARNHLLFEGNTPTLLKGTATGLKWVESKDFIVARDGGKAFNHIGATADFDKDGDLDLAIAAISPNGPLQYRLYVNDGQARFTWQESAVPNSALGASGTTFVKTGDNYSLVNGFYRAWDRPEQARDTLVMEYANGRFVESYTLKRPDLGGRELNYGVSDMYNRDVNGDGREDLLITWETENLFAGVYDGQSDLSGNPQVPRYKDLSNTLVTVALQDINGKLVYDPKTPVINLHSTTAGAQLYFSDMNKDGHLDFFASAFNVKQGEFYKQIFFNDGRGKFANPAANYFQFSDKLPDWYGGTPWFFDADSDGDLDVVLQRAVFGQDYAVRNIGEELRVFINDSPDTGQTQTVIRQVHQLYKTIFNREPDQSGATYWIGKITQGTTLADAAEAFVRSSEFVNIHGINKNEDLLTRCYQNVLGRDPDAEGYAWWLHQMEHNSQTYTAGRVVSGFMDIAQDLNIIGVQPDYSSGMFS